MRTFSVIDCGTNTFNLIIFSAHPKETVLYKEKIPVKIGFHLDVTGLIPEDAFQKACMAMQYFKSKTEEWKCESVVAVGTSALRDSSNGKELCEKIFQQYGIYIHIIDGNKEAYYIFQGVKSVLGKIPCTSLILDIGGGSNECIVTNDEKIFFSKSYPLGMGRILGKYPHSDSIRQEEILFYHSFFSSAMQDLWDVCLEHSVRYLIGASGVFDTLRDMHLGRMDDKENPVSSCVLGLEEFFSLHQKIVFSTMEEKKHIKGLAEMRRDMIVLSFVFIETVLRNTGIKEIICCEGSLKEGIVAEIIQDPDKWILS